MRPLWPGGTEETGQQALTLGEPPANEQAAIRNPRSVKTEGQPLCYPTQVSALLMTLAYAAEKYSDAVRMLAIGTGSVQNRLQIAALSFSPLQADDFAGTELFEKHESIMNSLTRIHEGPGEGYIQKTLLRMGQDEASGVAGQIVDLLAEIEYALRQAARLSSGHS